MLTETILIQLKQLIDAKVQTAASIRIRYHELLLKTQKPFRPK